MLNRWVSNPSSIKVDQILFKIANLCPNLVFYGYTHRAGLNYDKKPKNVVLNGSGFMIDNNFKTVKAYSTGALQCDGECFGCSYCKEAKGKVIEILEH